MQTINSIERSVKRRVQLAVGTLLLMTLMVVIFVLHPEYSRASVAHAEVERLQHESGSMGSTESRLEVLESELERRISIERTQLRKIPSGSDEAGLADALARSVDDGGASSWSVRMLDSEAVDSRTEGLNWMCRPAVIEMEGRFDTLIEALSRVEKSDRLVRVRMLRIGHPRGNSLGSGMIEATVELDTVFVKEDER
jgi:hypothetical protein